MSVGELFILGFFRQAVPPWLAALPGVSASAESSCSIPALPDAPIR